MAVFWKITRPIQDSVASETTLLISDATNCNPSNLTGYRVAGQIIVTDWPLDIGKPFLFTGFNPSDAVVLPEPTIITHGELLYDGIGWIGNADRHVVVRATESHSVIDIEGVGRFSVSDPGSTIQVLSKCSNLAGTMLTEVVMGLPFISALARRDIWMLHGSAAFFQGKLAVFLGESGHGKSTLARFLGKQEGWTRVADDILPLALCYGSDLEGICALPHYPQLKLSPAEQPANYLPECLAVDAIYAIAPPDDPISAVEICDLPPSKIIASLVGQGVAARIFDRKLLTRHFYFSHQIAATVPVRQLSYPRSFDVLPQVRELLQRDLESGTASDRLPLSLRK